MYCPHCAASGFSNLSALLRHIRITHADDPSIIFRCNLQGCQRSFKKFTVYRNHIYTYHNLSTIDEATNSDEAANADGHIDEQSFTGSHHDLSIDFEPEHEPMEHSTMVERKLQRAAALTLLKTREIHRIPLSVMDDIITDNQSLFSIALHHISDLVRRELVAANVSPEIIASATKPLTEQSPFTQLYSGLETQYKQEKYFRTQFTMIVSSLAPVYT